MTDIELDESYNEIKKTILDFQNSETVRKTKEKAREEVRIKSIINAYNLNISIENIAYICDTSIDKVKDIIKDYENSLVKY